MKVNNEQYRKLHAEGGPVQPATVRIEGPAIHDVNFPGLSIRDWFAGQALIGILANPVNNERLAEAAAKLGKSADYCAVVAAYTMADAVIVERQRS